MGLRSNIIDLKWQRLLSFYCIFTKVDKTCTFILYEMKCEDPDQYASWVHLQNPFLDDFVSIPLFSLNSAVLSLPAKHTKYTPYYKEFHLGFEHSKAVLGLEEPKKQNSWESGLSS